MSFETIDKILNLCSLYAEEIQWIWHGGEPTIMGIEWYKRVQELFYKYHNTNFKQSMQSNGVLLDENWAKLSNAYGIHIGVSYDVFTQDVRLGSQMQKIENNLKRYIEAGGDVGTITVINKTNYKRQVELYEYFKNTFGFNPAFNHIYRTDGSLNNKLEVSVEDYTDEFINYYKHWIYDCSKKSISERSVQSITNQIIGNRYLTCSHSDCRYNWVGINPIGDIFPCDRYVPNKYSMGNIKEYDSIEKIYENNGHKLYALEIQKRFLTHCTNCGYFNYCQGGCNANHIAVTGDATGIDEFSCELFKQKFNKVYDFLRNIDIYSKKLNKHFVKILVEEPFFTIKEIKEFLDKKGINTDFKYNSVDKNLIECDEFKIFRKFNPFKGETCGHIDFNRVNLNMNVQIDDNFDINSIKKQREEALEKIYNSMKDTFFD